MDRDYLERIDRHMARGNEHMARGNELMQRGNEIMDRVEREFQLMRELHADYMREMHEVRRGYRIANSELLRVVRENREAMRENREASRAQTDAVRDLREASKEHTRAILALLDRLGNGGAEPAI